MRRIFCAIVLVLCVAALYAETTVLGVVIDAETEEPVFFANVYFKQNTGVGTTTADDGSFTLKTTLPLDTLVINLIGYDDKYIAITPNKRNNLQRIVLQPSSYQLEAIEVTPKRKRERYVRKNNPAHELALKVIENKNNNRLESQPSYKVDNYEKMILALDNFDFKFDRNSFWKKFDFIENYLDSSQIDSTRILTISLREQLGTEYFRQHPRSRKNVVYAKRHQGVDKMLDQEGLGTNLENVFQPINIFDNNIDLLSNQFVSPLSSTLGPTFYRYYIIDTVMMAGQRCVDLAFVPVNTQSMGFTGHLYVLLDGSYALKGFELGVPRHINLNFVSRLKVQQEFENLGDTLWVPSKCDTYANFYLFSKKKQVYTHQNRIFKNYDFDVSESDTIFGVKGNKIVQDTAEYKRERRFWDENRYGELTATETVIDSLLVELKRIPAFNGIVKTVEVLVSNYVPTHRDSEKSYFDFGPIFNTISYNDLEGVRLRIGGMTTANLHPNFFMSGYVALGCKDLRVKYKGSLIYSFDKKKYHPFEAPRNVLTLSSECDVQTPGYEYTMFERDNILMSINMGNPLTRAQYVMYNTLKYEKEWRNNLSILTYVRHEMNEAAGTLKYEKYDAMGGLKNINRFHNFDAFFQLRYAPGERPYNSRAGRESIFNLSQGAPVLKLSHTIGYMFDTDAKSGFFHNRTDMSVEARLKMSAFGYMDAAFRAGVIWNKVPYPLLYIPNSNQSFLLQTNSFNTMLPMEFIADQYAAFHLTYHMNGLIFNRIPGFNRLKLREVFSMNMLISNLSNKNNPGLQSHREGLYCLPTGTQPMGKVPFIEASVGIENILKFLRVDYIFRCTYRNQVPKIKRGGVRFTFRVTI